MYTLTSMLIFQGAKLYTSYLTFHQCQSSLMLHGMSETTTLMNSATFIYVARIWTLLNCTLLVRWESRWSWQRTIWRRWWLGHGCSCRSSLKFSGMRPATTLVDCTVLVNIGRVGTLWNGTFCSPGWKLKEGIDWCVKRGNHWGVLLAPLYSVSCRCLTISD